jgi:hypothetical protein
MTGGIIMRLNALVPLLLLAACSDTAEADQKAKAAADKASLKLAAGQWETTTEITKVDAKDDSTPVLKTGRTVITSCIGESEGKKPAAPVLAGMEDCTYQNAYLARGRVNATMTCAVEGGQIHVSSEGQYGADSFETNAELLTYLSGSGDSAATAKISGRRTGTCTQNPPT